MSNQKRPRHIYAWDLVHKILSGTGSPLVVSADELITTNPRCKIEGAISIQEFKAMKDSIPKDREIIFYSTAMEDKQAAELAFEYQGGGFSKISILDGGIHAWNAIAPFLAARRSARAAPVH